MTLVIDASAVANWLMPDESTVDLKALAASHQDLSAPFSLWSEVRNALIVGERRGRLPVGATDRMLARLDQLNLTLDITPSSPNVLAIARKHNLTVYDALYLDLALRKSAALASLDAALLRAAQAEGVSLA